MSAQGFTAENRTDENGNPAGGHVSGTGLTIVWQNGPIKLIGTTSLSVYSPRAEPNGAFVEDVVAAAKQRLEYYQESKFSCRENALAITKLEEALHWLQHRTADRTARGVEGSHEQ